jgi:hypothetical protein
MKEDQSEKAKENKWQFKKWVEKLTLILLFFKALFFACTSEGLCINLCGCFSSSCLMFLIKLINILLFG